VQHDLETRAQLPAAVGLSTAFDEPSVKGSATPTGTGLCLAYTSSEALAVDWGLTLVDTA